MQENTKVGARSPNGPMRISPLYFTFKGGS